MADITTIDPKRAESLRWLSGRLDWDRQLDELREGRTPTPAREAAAAA